MKTFMQRKEDVSRKWYVIDAEGKTLGRLATKVAYVLRGKGKPTYTPHIDGGDYVIVVNANKVVLTGKKWQDKIYYSHSDYTGGLKRMTAAEMLEKFPTRLVEKAVKGMLPKTSQGGKMYQRLFVYDTPDHKHEAQKPERMEL